ncbi:MAG TPA: universal stress protein [Bacteroidales bacterium]|nr:universal stress protein [Bacteroidales bacterium]
MTMSLDNNAKSWNILIPYYFDAFSDYALQEGIALSKVFGAGLVLFHCNPDNTVKIRLAEMANNIISNHNIRTECFIPEGNQADLLFALAHKTESILIIIGHNCQKTSLGFSLKKTIRIMRKSRTPFLMVPEGLHEKSFRDIVYCMGYQKTEKEKILWASYFGRICKSRIHVAMPKVSDQFFKTGIRSNFQAMNKLYNAVEIDFKMVAMESNIHHAVSAAIEYGHSIQAGAFIILTTLRPDIFDFFGGADDIAAIRNKYSLPVFCINPRDDLYVLCN